MAKNRLAGPAAGSTVGIMRATSPSPAWEAPHPFLGSDALWRSVLVALFLGSGLLRLWLALGIPLHPDEAYYWTWSTRLDWSYYDQGPGVALWIAAFTGVFGRTMLALKLAAVVAAQLSLWLVFLAARELRLSRSAALLVVALNFFVPGFFAGSLLIMHDTVLILGWTAALYFAVRHVMRSETWTLYALFAALGFGVLGKHTMVLGALALLGWLAFERARWRLLRNPHLWGAVALGALLALPLLIWNVRNNWDGVGAIVHLRSSGGAAGGNATTGEYVAGQLLAFSPLWALGIFLLAARGLWGAGAGFPQKRWRALFPSADSAPAAIAARLVLWNAIVLPMFFLFVSLQRSVQANWVFASYPALLILLVRAATQSPESAGPEKAGSEPAAGFRRLILWTVGLGLVPALLLDAVALFSIPLSRLLPARPAAVLIPGYRTFGYQEAAREVEAVRQSVNPGALLSAERYQDAAILHWYTQNYVGSFNPGQKNQYSYWPTHEIGRDYIVFSIEDNVCEDRPPLTRVALDYMFERVFDLGARIVHVDGLAVKRVRLWHGRKLRRHWDERMVEYINEQAILHLMPNLTPPEKAATEATFDLSDPARLKELMNLVLQQFGQGDAMLPAASIDPLLVMRAAIRNPAAIEGCGLLKGAL